MSLKKFILLVGFAHLKIPRAGVFFRSLSRIRMLQFFLKIPQPICDLSRSVVRKWLECVLSIETVEMLSAFRWKYSSFAREIA
ncbi:hypothetical protein XarbCFBP8142_10600 [Xanthomonas arboricola]|nr:hypothetical protein XarbCFBP8142_10600 [Xanthomonas arboricola]